MKKTQKFVLLMILFIVGVGLYFYIGKEAFILLSIAVTVYLGISWVWSRFYCKGKKLPEGSIEFNLDKSGEFIMIGYLLCWSMALLGATIWECPTWYVWIIPIIMSLAYATRAHEVYKNSNDKIILDENLIKWQDDGQWVECRIKEFSFSLKKSDCISVSLSLSNIGWHLDLIDTNGESHSIDLKSLNLNGHKMSIQKAINRNL